MTDPASLRDRTRAAYERGRRRYALRLLWAVLPLIVLSQLFCGSGVEGVLLGGALTVAVLYMRWRGQGLALAAGGGLLAGWLCFSPPALVTAIGHSCAMGLCYVGCITPCIIGGLSAGIVLGMLVHKQAHPWKILVPALGITALCGALACTIIGAMGLGLMGATALLSAGVLTLARPALSR